MVQGSKAGSEPPLGSMQTHRVASERMRLISCVPHGAGAAALGSICSLLLLASPSTPARRHVITIHILQMRKLRCKEGQEPPHSQYMAEPG